MRVDLRIAGVVVAGLILAGFAQAGFVRVEDFEDLVPGPIDQQGGWVAASDSTTVAVDPAGGENQALRVLTESTHLHHEMVLPAGMTRMVFFRFRYADQLNCSFGLSDLTNPDRFDHFEVELSLTNATAELRINDDGTYRVVEVLEPDTWYNCWLQLDNDSDAIRVWVHDRPSQDAVAEDQLFSGDQSVFAFRNGTSGDLRSFYIKTGGGSGVAGPLWIDDLYIEDTPLLNLAYPGGAAPVDVAEDPSAIRGSLVAAPNPTYGAVRFRYTDTGANPTEVTLFDCRGRCVAALRADAGSGGIREVEWSGTDDAGRPVAPGLYFARTRSGADLQVVKVLVF